jgi:hypothetical protein
VELLLRLRTRGGSRLRGALLLTAHLRRQLGDALPRLVLTALDVRLRPRPGDLAARAVCGLGLLGGSDGIGLGDLGIAQDLRDAAPADAVEIAPVIGDVLDLQRVELEAELREVRSSLVAQAVRELEAVLVHFFGGHRREHAPQMALERLLADASDLVDALAEEPLDRIADEGRIARHLDVGDRAEGERDSALRVRSIH